MKSEINIVLIGPLAKAKEVKRALAKNTVVVAIDGGISICKTLKIKAHLAVGDWDSLKNSNQIEVTRTWAKAVKTYPVSKSKSDLGLGLDHCVNMFGVGAKRQKIKVRAFGFLGMRLDHHIASVAEFIRAAAHPSVMNIEVVGSDGRIIFLGSKGSHWNEKMRNGALLSLFSINGKKGAIVKLEGLRYKTGRRPIGFNSFGLSNQAVGGKVSVLVKSGGGLMIVIPSRYV